jgi:hypothetical protein
MIALVKAIVNKYEKGADLQSVSSGGMWLSLAPQRTSVPYITYDVISDNPVYTNTDIVGDYLVQFSMFAGDIESAIVMYEELEKLYNIRSLAIKNDDDFVVCSRENSTGPVLIDETWMVTADYQIMIRASRTAELIE